MHTANPAPSLQPGLSWFRQRTRRIVAAVVALALAATMAATFAMTTGDTSAAAGDDSAVVAGASWSSPRQLLRVVPGPGPGFDMLGASWS